MTASVIGTSTTSQTGKPAAAPVAPGGVMDKNAFMKLLVAQMTHQDPSNPSDSSAMAAQIAQFSSLEQLQNINDALGGQTSATAGMQGAINNSAAVSLIGKSVVAQSDQIAVGGTTATTTVGTDVPAVGGHVVLRITDANGVTLRTSDLGTVSGGRLNVPISTLTNGLRTGKYTVKFDYTDATGTVTNPPSYVTAKIDGTTFGATGTTVTSGPLSFPIGIITSVSAVN